MMEPINVNTGMAGELMALCGVCEVITQEIVKKREELGGLLTPSDIKSITKIPAMTWQPWLDDGLIIFSSPTTFHTLSHVTSVFKLSAYAKAEVQKEMEAGIWASLMAEVQTYVWMDTENLLIKNNDLRSKGMVWGNKLGN